MTVTVATLPSNPSLMKLDKPRPAPAPNGLCLPFGETVWLDQIMKTIEEVQSAILNLPNKDFLSLCRWLEEIQAARWDQQIEEDAKAGRLDHLAEQALKELREGKCKEL